MGIPHTKPACGSRLISSSNMESVAATVEFELPVMISMVSSSIHSEGSSGSKEMASSTSLGSRPNKFERQNEHAATGRSATPAVIGCCES